MPVRQSLSSAIADSSAFCLFVYQVPSHPSAARVGVWRELKRMGTLYLQQSVCVLPDRPQLRVQLERIAARVSDLGGSYHLLSVGPLGGEEEAKLVSGFIAQSNQQYDEIIENCEVNFTKEIEFEIFRENFIYAEAEEIRNDLEKIRRWFNRVVERDWYEAPRRAEAADSIEKCEQLLEQFEERVYAAESAVDMQGRVDHGPEG